MKKVIVIITLLIMICGCTNKEPFYLDDEFYKSNELIDITSTEFQEIINNEKSFALFIYTQGCITCFDFEQYLEEFQNTYNIKIYAMNAEEMKKTSVSKFIKYSPSVILYNKGKMISYLDAESNDDKEYYESTENFYKWFTKYIIIDK